MTYVKNAQELDAEPIKIIVRTKEESDKANTGMDEEWNEHWNANLIDEEYEDHNDYFMGLDDDNDEFAYEAKLERETKNALAAKNEVYGDEY